MNPAIPIRIEHIRTEHDPYPCTWTVHWPAIPRIGEHIEIEHAHDDNPAYFHSGTVRIVLWGEDGIPVVRFR